MFTSIEFLLLRDLAILSGNRFHPSLGAGDNPGCDAPTAIASSIIRKHRPTYYVLYLNLFFYDMMKINVSAGSQAKDREIQ